MTKLINQLIITVIPDTCPFARTLHIAGFTVTIPPLCKLNPFYEQLMQLKFNALNELASNLQLKEVADGNKT
jgi:hypothetical protein